MSLQGTVYADLKISVITAVYNCVSSIAQAVRSVQAQSWNSVEHVVIDGASTDGTVDVLQSCVNEQTVWVSEPDKGIYDALNKGMARTTGDVIGLMHSDDFFADEHVLAHVAAAFSDPGVDAVYGDLDYVAKDDTTRIIRRWRSGDYQPAKLACGCGLVQKGLAVARGYSWDATHRQTLEVYRSLGA